MDRFRVQSGTSGCEGTGTNPVGREDWGGGGNVGVMVVETVDRRAGRTGRWFGLGWGRRDDDDEGAVLELT